MNESSNTITHWFALVAILVFHVNLGVLVLVLYTLSLLRFSKSAWGNRTEVTIWAVFRFFIASSRLRKTRLTSLWSVYRVKRRKMSDRKLAIPVLLRKSEYFPAKCHSSQECLAIEPVQHHSAKQWLLDAPFSLWSSQFHSVALRQQSFRQSCQV